METIGQRAAKAIRHRAMYEHSGRDRVITLKNELDRLNIPHDNYYDWKRGRSNPSAHYLGKMALAGYDVFWILTGKEKQ